MKVRINKLDAIGDMEFIKEQKVSYETMYSNKQRTTTERIFRIELIFEMSNGDTHVSNAYISKFAYKPAGSVLNRYPVDDIADLDRELRAVPEMRDFDVNEDANILDKAAQDMVHAYASVRNPNCPTNVTPATIARRLNQIGN